MDDSSVEKPHVLYRRPRNGSMDLGRQLAFSTKGELVSLVRNGQSALLLKGGHSAGIH